MNRNSNLDFIANSTSPYNSTKATGDCYKVPKAEKAEPEILSLDELLSQRALEILNGQGFVSFKLYDELSGLHSFGWIARTTRKVVEKENVALDCPQPTR